MNTDDPGREWLYALAAARLSQGERRGERPSALEIDRWRLGQLSPPRADEVLSHVAHDPQCYAQWRSLCEEQRWLEREAGEPTLEQPGGGAAVVRGQGTWLGAVAARLGLTDGARPRWAGAVAACLVALLLVPLLFPGGPAAVDLYEQQLERAGAMPAAAFPALLGRETKAVDPLAGGVVDPDRAQFRMGLAAAAERLGAREGAGWADWLGELPRADACDGAAPAHCSAAGWRNRTLGGWALVTLLACERDASDASFWREQAEALDALVTDGLAPTHFLAARLRPPLPRQPAALCATARGLLGQGG